MISWRAGCAERCTSGSEGGPGKRTGRKPGTAPRSDPYTRLRCWDGVLYFAFVIDVFSRRVVGWQLATHMRDTLVIDALRMALAQRRPGADVVLVVHSDAGSQYTSYDHTQVLDDHEVLQSIGTVGDALDNAMAESFVDSFKTELIRDRAWPSRTGLEFAIVEYLGWFNHDRLHSPRRHPTRRVRGSIRTELLQPRTLINIII
jgi:transposase InsO family protein